MSHLDQYKSPDDENTSTYFRAHDEAFLNTFFGDYNTKLIEHAKQIMHESCDVITAGFPTMLNNEYFNDQCKSFKKMNMETGEYIPDEGWGWNVSAGNNGITKTAMQNMHALCHIANRCEFLQKNPNDEDAKQTEELIKELNCSEYIEFAACMSLFFPLFFYHKQNLSVTFFFGIFLFSMVIKIFEREKENTTKKRYY